MPLGHHSSPHKKEIVQCCVNGSKCQAVWKRENTLFTFIMKEKGDITFYMAILWISVRNVVAVNDLSFVSSKSCLCHGGRVGYNNAYSSKETVLCKNSLCFWINISNSCTWLKESWREREKGKKSRRGSGCEVPGGIQTSSATLYLSNSPELRVWVLLNAALSLLSKAAARWRGQCWALALRQVHVWGAQSDIWLKEVQLREQCGPAKV